jgi:serine/threonine protein kinase
MYCGEWMTGERAVVAWNTATVIVPLLPVVICFATSSFLYIRTLEELMAIGFAAMLVFLALTVAATIPLRAMATLVAAHMCMFVGNVSSPTGISEMRKNIFLCMATSFGAGVGLVLRRVMIDAFRAAGLRGHAASHAAAHPSAALSSDGEERHDDGVPNPCAGPASGATDASCSSASSKDRLSWTASLATATSDERRVMDRVFRRSGGRSALTPRVLAAQCSLHDVQVRAFVGAGAQGEVYLAAFTGCTQSTSEGAASPEGAPFEDSGRAVACKRMHRMHVRSEECVLRELQLLELHLGLQHPNIIRLIAVAWDVETALILTVMEYAQRGSLADLLHSEGPVHRAPGEDERRQDATPRGVLRLSRAQQLEIALGVAKGLAYLHSQQPPILHRDLKPSNVLLDERLTPLLCDFGMSRHEASSGSIDAMTAVGTPHFAAPEVISHMPYNVSADVWSFGALLACFCHGGLPYDAVTVQCQRTLLLQVSEGRLRPEVPDEHPFASLLPRCVRYAPEERVRATDAVASLIAMLEHERMSILRMIESLPVD